jgi:hypothetical protein
MIPGSGRHRWASLIGTIVSAGSGNRWLSTHDCINGECIGGLNLVLLSLAWWNTQIQFGWEFLTSQQAAKHLIDTIISGR